ncbi:GDP-mannose mannosyl hydrolase [Trinickia fusca]|uniref:NUDIX domain-containing protein n=1 Tax=Trinickia fusca TaxID=2419777 RepID=A0A494XKM1_9BURK|nr:NUDIX domain-containing protein [Trinickia fusca]RKP51265.1 NUDIX domain-containing protein [Trinickia fusca]
MLTDAEFLEAVRLTPLISIDLIASDEHGRVLVGERRHAPARGSWFVPGGRIRKDESLDAAFARTVEDELGIAHAVRGDARFVGVFEHHYADENFAAAPGISTHYIVLAYALAIAGDTPLTRFAQHHRYAWLLPDELRLREDVHAFTKAYFDRAQQP